MNIYKALLSIIILILVTACTPNLDLLTPEYTPKLSIECILYPDSVPKLFLSRSQVYLGSKIDDLGEFVSDATVSITDGVQTDPLIADSAFDLFTCRMKYFYKGNIPTEVGKDYTLTIIDKGVTYTAQTSTKLSKPVINKITFVEEFLDIFGEHEGIVLNYTDISGEENFYRYQVFRPLTRSQKEGPQCADGKRYLASEVGRSVYNDLGNDGKTSEFLVEPAIKHKEGDTAFIVLQLLDPKTAKFYDQLDKQRLLANNPFVEPVFLATNIEGALGIFGAVNVSAVDTVILPDF